MRSGRALHLLPLVAGLASAPLVAQTPTAPKVSGYLQPRFQVIGDSGLFFLRRARLGAQGSLAAWASYKVQAELRTGGSGTTSAALSATDLYVALAHGAWAGTLGQFKTPFSREFLISSTALELPDRSLVVDALAPNRDIGTMVEWKYRTRLTVQGGAFNGEGANHAENRDKRLLYVGRVVVEALPGLELGGAAAGTSDSSDWNIETVVHRGPWSGRAEYLRRDRSRPADHRDGWYAQAAYASQAIHLQLVGRVEQFDPTAAPLDRITGYTAGAQYFFRGDDLKALASYTVFTEQGPAGRAGPAASNNRFVLQMQARW